MKPRKKQKSDSDMRRQLWWSVFAVALLLVVMDLMHVSGNF